MIELDTYDHAILDALIRDSTRTNADLAGIANLSPSQCSRRRARLEAEGIITGYGARVNHALLGFGLRAITRVNLSAHSQKTAERFAAFLARHDEVQSAWSVSGDADYVLLILTRDLERFAAFVHRELLPFEQVSQVRSEIVLMTLKGNGQAQ